MIERPATLRPSDFCRLLLNAMEAAEGRKRRRKRDQTADSIGLSIKRWLLQQAIDEDPAPEEFEGWLLLKALTSPASGPIRALAGEIFDEYRLATLDPSFSRWLAEGAPSDDAREDRPKSDDEVSGGSIASVLKELSP